MTKIFDSTQILDALGGMEGLEEHLALLFALIRESPLLQTALSEKDTHTIVDAVLELLEGDTSMKEESSLVISTLSLKAKTILWGIIHESLTQTLQTAQLDEAAIRSISDSALKVLFAPFLEEMA